MKLEVDRVAERVAVDRDDPIAARQTRRRGRRPGATAATVTPAGSAEQGVFRRVLSLDRGRGVEEPHALDDVLKS